MISIPNFDATHYRISYEKIQGSNGLITHLEEEAEATSISIIPKDDGTRDINGGDYGEEEDAGSGEESDDVSSTLYFYYADLLKGYADRM
jgi:hypothetical protein